MPSPGSTAARGYGAQHRAQRAKVKPLVDAGLAYCSRCHGWIDPAEPWDLDHTDDRDGYHGPAHRSCNRRAGAIKGKARHSGVARRRRAARSRIRVCEICGSQYKASAPDQRTCGRACGGELRRRNAPPKAGKQPYERVCSECAQLFITNLSTKWTCGPSCASARNGRLSRERYHNDPTYRAATMERSKRSGVRRWNL